MINSLEELYSFYYNGSSMDISAVLVYIRNKDGAGAQKYLADKGIVGNDAKELVVEIIELMKAETDFADGGSSSSYSSSSNAMFGEPVFSIDGNRGRHLRVYEDYV